MRQKGASSISRESWGPSHLFHSYSKKTVELLLSCRLMSTNDGRADVGVLPEHTWRIPNRNKKTGKVADIILSREKYSCVIQVTLRTKWASASSCQAAKSVWNPEFENILRVRQQTLASASRFGWVLNDDNDQGKKFKIETKKQKKTPKQNPNRRPLSITEMNGGVKVRKRVAEKLYPGLKSSRLRRALTAAQRSHSNLEVPFCRKEMTK